MSRAPKNNISTAVETAAQPLLTPEMADLPPMGREFITSTRHYSRPIQPDEEKIPAITDDQFESDDTLEESGWDDEEPTNLFDFEGDDEESFIRVYQFAQPNAGGRFTKGGQTYVGDVADTPHFLRDVQQSFGGGLFRLQRIGWIVDEDTGKRRQAILNGKTVRIAGPVKNLFLPETEAPIPAPPVAPVVENPIQPAYVQPQPQVSALGLLKEQLQIQKMLREATGDNGQHQQPVQAPPPLDPEVEVIKLMAGDEDVKSKMAKSLFSKFFGGASVAEPDPWYASVITDAIKSGQGPEIISSLVGSLFNGVRSLFPATGGNNATPPMAQANAPNQAHSQIQVPIPEGQQQGTEGQQQGVESGLGESDLDEQTEEVMPPQEELLLFVCNQCVRKVPPPPVVDSIMKFAEHTRTESPLEGPVLDFMIGQFATMPTADALAFVAGNVPGGDQVAALPHAVAWTQELQTGLRKRLKLKEPARNAKSA